MHRTFTFLVTLLLIFSATAQESEQWWGYYDGSSDRTAVGYQKEETYNVCTQIKESELAGMKANALRFYLRSTTDITDLTLWISRKRPTSADQADYYQPLDLATLNGGDADNSHLGQPNLITLTTPYEIPDGTFYLGYSFTVSSTAASSGKYPVVVGSEKRARSLYMKTSASSPDWTDMGSKFGCLAIEMLLQSSFAQYSAYPSDFGSSYVLIGGEVQIPLTVTNLGSAGIQDFDYTVTTDGVTTPERHCQLAEAVTTFGASTEATITLAADAEAGPHTKTIAITRVNGQPNESQTTTAQGTLNTIAQLYERRVVVEEYTGTGCGYCPRGLQGMENLRETFGDSFIGIGIHRYNTTDPMYPMSYADIKFTSAPMCRINRGIEMDPYYGTSKDIRNDVSAELTEGIPEIDVTITSSWTDQTRTAVEATATIEAITDDVTYDIEFCLTADSLVGTTNVWAQANYYYSQPMSGLPDDLKKFANGGAFGRSYFTGWVFNDVVISSSYTGTTNNAGTLGKMAPLTPVTRTWTLNMPTKEELVNALVYDKIYAVVLIVNRKTGRIANAAKVQVGGSAAIDKVTADSQATVAYDLMGQPARQRQAGKIYIEQGRKFMLR